MNSVKKIIDANEYDEWDDGMKIHGKQVHLMAAECVVLKEL